MKQVIVLQNEMFDNGSVQNRTFCIKTQGDFEYKEWSQIENYFADDVLNEIKKNLNSEHKYINLIKFTKMEYTSNYERILEISWD